MLATLESASPAAPTAGLRVDRLSKAFPGTQALDSVSFNVGAGRIGALLGGNGSGKSTLIKILAGVVAGDAGGRIHVGDVTEASDRVTPAWARSAGLAFVHQDLGLFDVMTVAENVFAGARYPRRHGRVDWRAIRREAQATLDRLGIGVDAGLQMKRLRASDRTLVAVARALRGRESFHEGVLVLDEPTARLPAAEVELLITALRGYAGEGQTVLFVSHRLDEVLEIADEVTVLRDGRLVGSRARAGLDERGLVEMIVGRAGAASSSPSKPPPRRTAKPLLVVRRLTTRQLRGIDLEVHPGEILGVAGLVGAGRTTLLETIAGVRRADSGSVTIEGKDLPEADISGAMRRGLVYVPEDRAGEGAFLGMSLAENLSAGDLTRYWHGLRFRHRDERRDAALAIDTFNIRSPSPRASLITLSGGNQQKAVLARWLGCRPRVLLLDEPTQGVDVGARADIYLHLRAAVHEGMAILLVSSDLAELLELADRVLVLGGGRIVAERDRGRYDRHWLEEQVHFASDERIGTA
jgi:ribose transport system ATP-binding protein